MEKRTPTVTQVVNQIKDSLESQFRTLSVVGEVSNLTRSGAGHYYFTLSDPQSSLSACLFRGDALRNSLIKEIKDGDKIIASGSIGVYGKKGTFQLISKRITAAGEGDLRLELEKLKKRLAGEGLFDLEAKKEIPKFPKRIGLITAEKSAAFYDFINIVNRRTSRFNILLAPATVQGEKASDSIRASLFNLIKYNQKCLDENKVDVIVLTRGGGSLEDLWCFNDEGLAWDIYNCPIPVISAVGHEVDFSISDFVSDKRCETPSAAAEVLSESQFHIKSQLTSLKRNLRAAGTNLIKDYQYQLQGLAPKQALYLIERKLQNYYNRLDRCRLKGRLVEFTSFNDHMLRLEDCYSSLKNYPDKIDRIKIRLENQYNLLRVLNPDNVLGRGYSYLKDQDGVLISDIEKFDNSKSSSLNIFFKDGVREVNKERSK